MIVCPIEGTVIFSKCPVHTCMWYKGTGGCSHGEPQTCIDSEDIPEDSEIATTKVRILHYVTVGAFLEATAGKELANFTNSDFPKKEPFTTWCKQRSVKLHRDIPYSDIVSHIREAL